MTDVEIEAEAKRCGGRWNGDAWVFEDADLHPFARSLMAAENERLRAALRVLSQAVPNCVATYRTNDARKTVGAAIETARAVLGGA